VGAFVGLCAGIAAMPVAAVRAAPPADAGVAAPKADSAPSRAVVEAALTSTTRPVGARELAELGPRVDETLLAITRDANAATSLRARAIAAMAYVRSEPVVKYLRATIDRAFDAKTPDDRMLVRKAALSYGWIGIPESPTDLAPLLGHPDADVRVDAGVALALTRLKDAVPPLERHVESEKDPWVRRQLARQLDQLKKYAGTPPKRRSPVYRPGIPPGTSTDPYRPRFDPARP
jgi:HEAT repeat protein